LDPRVRRNHRIALGSGQWTVGESRGELLVN
jgi:hypothetical protein